MEEEGVEEIPTKTQTAEDDEHPSAEKTEHEEDDKDVEEEEEVVEEEEEEEREKREVGPRDAIRVTVLAFTQTEEQDLFYNIQVVINEGNPLLLHRRYEDMKWLYRLLSGTIDLGGNILPPMPASPTPPPVHLEQLGTPQSSMFGDHTKLPCLEFESFLQSLADHAFFSLHHEVHSFLTSTLPLTHDPLPSPSLWSTITSAYTNYTLGSLQDTDDDFVETLRLLNERVTSLENCTRHFDQLVTAMQRMACAQLKVSTCLKEEGEWEVGRNDGVAISLNILSSTLNELQSYNHSTSTDATNTLGFTFDLYLRYNKQAKEMLFRRLEKLQTLINASKQLDKAKPEKKEEMEKVRLEAMDHYHEINSTAKSEMEETISKRCVLRLKKNAVDFAESQLTHSRCLLAQLNSLHSQLSIT